MPRRTISSTRAGNVVLVLDGDALGHVADLEDTDQTGGKLEHVVAQGDDDELGVLGALLDVVGDDGDLQVRKCQFSVVVKEGERGVLTFRKSNAASISSMTYSGVGL